MKPTFFAIVLLSIVTTTFAQQTIESILSEVEKNNTSLSAFRQNMDAEKIGNKTGLTPQNPEVEFNYLWGNPSAIGNRTDFNIRQSFDFPTAYVYKNQISELKNKQADLEYQKKRREILHQTRLVCIELTYLNALKSEFGKRLENATQIANAYKLKFDIGDVSILEFNKAQVNLLNCSNDAKTNEVERNALLSELRSLNGGKEIDYSTLEYSQTALLPDFEQWYAQAEQGNPVLQWIQQEITISEKQKQLQSALNLPKFNAGYMSEKVVGEQFQGVSVGMSIPLWENKSQNIGLAKRRERSQIAILQPNEIPAFKGG
jgi:outer membrane protein TolC